MHQPPGIETHVDDGSSGFTRAGGTIQTKNHGVIIIIIINSRGCVSVVKSTSSTGRFRTQSYCLEVYIYITVVVVFPIYWKFIVVYVLVIVLLI